MSKKYSLKHPLGSELPSRVPCNTFQSYGDKTKESAKWEIEKDYSIGSIIHKAYLDPLFSNEKV